ncbi:response regulator [Massilia forsythiae]|uniref:Chemotaxis protein CheA n=1 Tax=Massilia forsythiae TaxID=2728020 RepID=A0A7Z2VWQ0_9BURK|nr:Hpt domain-containing protein [Massilia forsythiae]QJE00604.1 response regulator [Massilia forsythiae]
MTETTYAHAHAPQFDTGPLSWVIGEIRDALDRSSKALQDAAGRTREARPTLLLHARSHLHQAHGALQMVDVGGVDRLTEAAESAIDRFKDGSLALDDGAAATVGEAYRALVEYLEELLEGAQPAHPQPVRLFPYYRALQELLGAERVHPGDMLVLDPAPRLPAPKPDGAAPDYAASRALFEKALLPFLKSADPAAQRAQAGAMRDALAPLARAQAEPNGAAFWLALQSAADLVAQGQVPLDLYVKQLFGQINLQLRRMGQGHTGLPDALLRDALFFIALADQPTPDARLLRDAWHLDGQVPQDYLERRYGRIDPAALKDARQALAETKQGWDRIAGEDGAAQAGAAQDGNFDDALAKLAGASEKLGAPALAQLLRELGQAASESIAGGRSDQFSLEMAEAMLFVEHGLDQVRQLPEDFGQHAEAVGQRLLALAHGETPPEPSHWQADMARELHDGQTVAVLAGEMRTGLRQVEKLVDEYHDDPTRRASLQQADLLLHQLHGALAILDQDAAARALTHVRGALRALAAGDVARDARAAALDNVAQNIGALGFFTDALAQNVEAAKRRFRFDDAAGLFQELPFEALHAAQHGEPAEVAPQADGAAPAMAASPAQSDVPVQAVAAAFDASAAAPQPEGDAIEAELLDIFIAEAGEVLGVVAQALPAARANPASQETLTRLRRAFHTLKGSGRMVGLEQFALAAAAIEKTMNLWLAEARAATPDLQALLERAHGDLSAWVVELAARGASARSGAALAAAAARVQDGGAFVMDDAPAAEPAETGATAEPAQAAVQVREPEPAVALEPQADFAPWIDDQPAPAAAPAQGQVGAADAGSAAEPEPAPVVEAVAEAPPESAAVPPRVDETELQFAPDIAAAGSVPASAPAPAAVPEQAVAPHEPSVAPPADEVKHIGELAIPLPLYHIYLGEAEGLIDTLARDGADWRATPLRAVAPQALKAAHTLGGTSATVGFDALRDIAFALEAVLQMATPPLDDAQHALLDETVERARTMLQVFALGEAVPAQPELVARLDALRDELGRKKADALFGSPDPELARRLDELFAAAYTSILSEPPPADQVLPDAADRAEAAPATPVRAPEVADPAVAAVDDLFDTYFDDPFAAPSLEQAAPETASLADGEALRAADAPSTGDDAIASIEARDGGMPVQAHAPADDAEADAESGIEADADADAAIAGEPVFSDELDPDLLPVFMEEAADLLPQIGDGLRRWQRDPHDGAAAQGLLRALHTVKGSARMAGAMRLGQHTHALETQIENMLHAGTTNPVAFDELLANYDQAQLLFEQLQQPAAAPDAPAASAPDQDATASTAEAQPEPAARTPLVRVRADILDRLVNQAGEVSITRSKLETQVGAMKGALADFSDNLARLRRQLREVEVQAESQIASRLSIAGEREFDPLEFDRFTRLQELTRMMAESVNDVATFHDSLTRSVDAAGGELAAQSRQTRELQRDLMRARMVPFASLSERLFRVARQTAKETDKRVNLDIRGGAVEIDRSVLEQMAAPFEHLLRNAIVHGIEPRERRLAAGKAETGEVLVQVRQHGNEVEIRFADDGAGLDLARIRAKAQAAGLVAQDEVISDQDAAELVFEPGFSTADALTELAGRGVGMDVVRSEARALGGRVEIASEAGKGAAFAIHLPLTLAATQAVLVASGARTYALPAVLVEQLVQVRAAELAAAHESGMLALHGESLPLHYLPALLREPGAAAVQRSAPVMILRSGAARLALQVDQVLGNREVVVKNIGPQLARMPGIAGATVLGSGEIVLILDPVILAGQGAARTGAGAAVQASAALPAGLGATLMVIDDSLTVRRVTQRLLEREGYRVLLAKDGVDALERMQETRPDLMLVDIEMPRMDGFDLTRHVRGNESTRAIPIVMITSRSADKHRNYALDLGVDAYFGKPFQEQALLAAIAGLLGREAPRA